MTMKRLMWPVLLLGITSSAWADYQPNPAADIQSILSASAVVGSEGMPGMLTGERLRDLLNQALEMIRGGVAEAARPELENVLRELSAIQKGDRNLPAAYRVGDETWLPVQLESLRVTLDPQELDIRSSVDGPGGRVGDLAARARRIRWLPVGRVMTLVEQTLPLLATTETGRERAGRLVSEALTELRTEVELQDQAWLDAYYRVEHALGDIRHWNDDSRQSLRSAAETLARVAGGEKLAHRIQALADSFNPEVNEFQDLAQSLRLHIESAAKETGR
ncbi:MAG: hypothetical protein KDH88_13550 [Chromatiales bacterium]|nr:hypothetical protein [Chromatiales bacterium]